MLFFGPVVVQWCYVHNNFLFSIIYFSKIHNNNIKRLFFSYQNSIKLDCLPIKYLILQKKYHLSPFNRKNFNSINKLSLTYHSSLGDTRLLIDMNKCVKNHRHYPYWLGHWRKYGQVVIIITFSFVFRIDSSSICLLDNQA